MSRRWFTTSLMCFTAASSLPAADSIEVQADGQVNFGGDVNVAEQLAVGTDLRVGDRLQFFNDKSGFYQAMVRVRKDRDIDLNGTITENDYCIGFGGEGTSSLKPVFWERVFFQNDIVLNHSFAIEGLLPNSNGARRELLRWHADNNFAQVAHANVDKTVIRSKETEVLGTLKVRPISYLSGSTPTGTSLLRLESIISGDSNRVMSVLSPDPQNANDHFQIHTNNAFSFRFDGAERIFFNHDGTAEFTKNVQIGTSTTDADLTVYGDITVTGAGQGSDPWPDYVFADDYELADLKEVKAHIAEHKRLPGIPSAEQVSEDGISVGSMSRLHMEKIEELTLYVIQQQDEIQQLKAENAKLQQTEARLAALEEQMQQLLQQQ